MIIYKMNKELITHGNNEVEKHNFNQRKSPIFIDNVNINTAQKLKFSIKDFFCNCDQIYSFLQIWSHLLKKSLMENFIFCAV